MDMGKIGIYCYKLFLLQLLLSLTSQGFVTRVDYSATRTRGYGYTTSQKIHIHPQSGSGSGLGSRSGSGSGLNPLYGACDLDDSESWFYQDRDEVWTAMREEAAVEAGKEPILVSVSILL